MYSFSKFCIPHWLSSLQQHRRKVLKETQKNHIKTFILGKLPSNITTIVPFSFGDPAIARSENKFSLVANTSRQSEQNGVRIPRQILVSHDLNRPIIYRWWWQPLSQPRFGTQALSRVTQRLRKLWMEFAKICCFLAYKLWVGMYYPLFCSDGDSVVDSDKHHNFQKTIRDYFFRYRKRGSVGVDAVTWFE